MVGIAEGTGFSTSAVSESLRAAPCPVLPSNASCSTTATMPSFRYCAPRGNIEAVHVQQRRVWEPDNTAVVAAVLRAYPDAALLDVGARAGWFTMLGLTHHHHVIAVEANWHSVCFLQHNVAINHLESQKAFVINRPVSDISDQPVHMNGIHVQTNLSASSSPPLMTMQLDAVVPLLPSKAELIIQMDIEGFECKALLGARTLLLHANIVGIVHEYSDSTAGFMGGCTWAPVFHELRSMLKLVPHRIVSHGRGKVVELQGPHATWKAQGLSHHSNLLWRKATPSSR